MTTGINDIRNPAFLYLKLFFTICVGCLASCINEPKIITVTKKIRGGEMGKTLHHEHLLDDFIGAGSTGAHRWNKDSVADKVLPYLLEMKNMLYKSSSNQQHTNFVYCNVRKIN